MKNSEKLMKIKTGDTIVFQKGEEPLVVMKDNYRYALACTGDGTEYTIVDKKEKILASTTYTFEKYANFNKKENAEKMLELLHSGERELSRKYRDTFAEFDVFAENFGSEIILM